MCQAPALGVGARALVKTGQTLLSWGSHSGRERHCKNKNVMSDLEKKKKKAGKRGGVRMKFCYFM